MYVLHEPCVEDCAVNGVWQRLVNASGQQSHQQWVVEQQPSGSRVESESSRVQSSPVESSRVVSCRIVSCRIESSRVESSRVESNPGLAAHIKDVHRIVECATCRRHCDRAIDDDRTVCSSTSTAAAAAAAAAAVTRTLSLASLANLAAVAVIEGNAARRREGATGMRLGRLVHITAVLALGRSQPAGHLGGGTRRSVSKSYVRRRRRGSRGVFQRR